jgi:hypothetical protein
MIARLASALGPDLQLSRKLSLVSRNILCDPSSMRYIMHKIALDLPTDPEVSLAI